MNLRSTILRVTCVIAVIVIGLPASVDLSANSDRPNVVFILADDLSYKTVGYAGSPEVKSPRIDRLAEQGVVFDKAFNMGAWSGAVCVASRNMLNTGLTVWRAKQVELLMKDKSQSALQEQSLEGFWGNRMAAAGYDTYMTGKWHLSAPVEGAFAEHGTVRPGMPNQTQERYDRSFDPVKDSWSPYDKSMEGFWKGGTHWSEVQANEAIEYLDRKKGAEKPFFMYVAFNAPHDPRQSPKEYIDLYPLTGISLPESFVPKHPYMEAMGLMRGIPQHLVNGLLRDEALAPMPRSPHSIKVNRREYFALITHLDTQIGRILDRLEENRQMDNTVIIFTADHGLAVGEHGLLGKQNMYDHSLRAPFVIAGTDIPTGEWRSTPIYLQDAMATTLEIAGASLAGIEFKSVLPLIEDERKTSYASIYGSYLDSQRAVIKDNFKLILYPAASAMELYDLGKDPDELNNLAGNPELKGKIKLLFGALLELQSEFDDDLDLSSVYPELL